MSTPEPPPTAGTPPVDLPEELSAVYSNLVRISHSPSDIVFDFGQILPMQKPRILSRVVMSPMAAKLFFNALKENLARYEATFGEIRLPGDNSLASDLFKQIRPPDSPKAE
jgi:hypothetical protein